MISKDELLKLFKLSNLYIDENNDNDISDFLNGINDIFLFVTANQNSVDIFSKEIIKSNEISEHQKSLTALSINQLREDELISSLEKSDLFKNTNNHDNDCFIYKEKVF